MTRMSDLADRRHHPAAAKRLTLHARRGLVRRLHGSGVLVGSLVVVLTACVIPPALSVEQQDAGVNSPPAILAIRSNDSGELPEPGPVLFDRGTGTLVANLIDTDLDDTLFVRVFVDYTVDSPTAPRVSCTARPGDGARRTVTCDAGALCLPGDIDVQRNMHIFVFDREPLEGGKPPFQAMPEGGLATNRFYFLRCKEPAS